MYHTIIAYQIRFSIADFDDCVGYACRNGGTCTDFVGGYKCECFPGTFGGQCQYGMCNICMCMHGSGMIPTHGPDINRFLLCRHHAVEFQFISVTFEDRVSTPVLQWYFGSLCANTC